MNFFKDAGHPVIGFLPDYLLNSQQVEGEKLAAKRGGWDVKKKKLPDNMYILEQLVESGVLVGTPPQDYDDSYTIRYAQNHGGVVLSNDMYRDNLEKITDQRQRDTQRRWFKEHLISFTFVGDELHPNPDFVFPAS